jgi:uncharacterized protein (DUF305 family)
MPRTRLAGGLAALMAVVACSRPVSSQAPTAPQPVGIAALKYVQADVDFMTGMIHHHSQAVLIAGWATTHGASDPMIRLTERIVVGQNDEIGLMQRWLRDRQQQVPEADTAYAHHMGMMDHDMPGMDHSMMNMPGMLSPAQLDSLDKARGPVFDRLFLNYMIQHHRGAIVMVDKLFGTEGAGQDETTFRLASDIYADQTTEIDRMQKMLAALPSGDQHQ